MSDIQKRIAGLSAEKRILLEEKMARFSTPNYGRKPIVRRAGGIPVPSFGQERLWAIEQIESGSAGYNVCFSLVLKGSVDLAALKSALKNVVGRHETLRTRYVMNAQRGLQLEISETAQVPLPVTDLSAVACERREEVLSEKLRAEANRPILLDRDPVFRAVLYRLSACEHVLQLTVHHVASDGWSMGIFFRDFEAFYNAEATKTTPQLPELPITYSDYASWQREQLDGPEGERLISYWKEQIKGSSFALELPTDRPRPPVQTFRGASRHYSFSADLVSALKEFCLSQQVTPFMAVLAALYTVLSRYSGQNDILVGSPIAARSRMETENLVGFFTNTVLMRGNLDGDPSFSELLQRVKQTALGAYSHQDLPLEWLASHVNAERKLNRSALFQVLLVFQNVPTHKLDLHGVDASFSELRTDTALFDLVVEMIPAGEAFDGAIHYNSDLFDPTTIDRLWGHLTMCLGQAISAPEVKAAAIPLLTPAEQQQMLVEWNATERQYPRDTPLATFVESHVQRIPNAIAVACDEQKLTYRELNQKANQLSCELRKHGAGPDEVIAVCMERSTDLIVAMLAIMKAGAAYLPLDPLLPTERLGFMLEDSCARLLVTNRSTHPKLPEFDGTAIEMEDRGWQSNCVDDDPVAVKPEHLAYVIYTSGSTGRPKGVEVSRGALMNLLWFSRGLVHLGECDWVLAVTTISFDPSGMDIWLPLMMGAHLMLANSSAAADGRALKALLEHNEISCIFAAPVIWRLLLEAGWRGSPRLVAAYGGEVLPPEVATKLVPMVKQMWNVYGPTETTIYSTCHLIADGRESIPIGPPIANTQCYILNAKGQPVPIGVTGELYIGGDGLARGYRNRPELTAERFVPNPFRGGSARMYRTGDLARYRANGDIECLGRIDHQVKIRGYRIELGEIETVLKEIPDIKQAVVVARADAKGDKQLVAYLVASAGAAVPAPAEIRYKLKQSLPDYMVPSAYAFLERIPISLNGKIDLAALPPPTEMQTGSAETYVAPRSALEKTLAALWAEELGMRQVGIRDNFFELGGHSLKAVRLFAKILAVIPDFQPSLALLLKAPTVEQFAQTLQGGQADWSYLVPLREGGERPPFFCIHGAGGNVLDMRELAMAMPPDLPIYFLQARGLDGHSEPFSSVEETAECYIEQIRKVQPCGPYFLGGRSYGGTVAFEMARRLHAMGETVSMVALVDTYNYAYGHFLSRPKLLYLNSLFFLRRIRHHIGMLGSIEFREWGSYIVRHAKILRRLAHNVASIATGGAGIEYGGDPPPIESQASQGSLELEELLMRIQNASVLAVQRYIPKPYDGQLLLFRARNHDDDPYNDDALGWRPVARGGVIVCEVDGDHFSILRKPQVYTLARRLDAALRRAQGSEREGVDDHEEFPLIEFADQNLFPLLRP